MSSYCGVVEALRFDVAEKNVSRLCGGKVFAVFSSHGRRVAPFILFRVREIANNIVGVGAGRWIGG